MKRPLLPFLLLMLAACDSDVMSIAGPNNNEVTNPSTPTSGSTLAGANWIGDATVTASAGSGGCGWGRTLSETRSGVLWRIVVAGNTVTLDEDMVNWPTDHIPYAGTLNGVQFAALYKQTPSGVCQFTGGTLNGTFSDDFSTLTADETLTWGEGATQTIVQRHWQVRKR